VPQLLITDISMPDADGYQLLREVRARPDALGGQVPAVALTAHARPQDRERSLKAGFQAHLGKPIDMGVFIRTVVQIAHAPCVGAVSKPPERRVSLGKS